MNDHSSNTRHTRAVVTVAEMARMCGLSRSRFYQLQKAGVFPPPCFSPFNRRPLYVEEQQHVCLEVRRRNCGVNGQPVLFYSRRLDLAAPLPRGRAAAARPTRRQHPYQHTDLIDALAALWLSSVTAPQVEAALRVCFTDGMHGIDQGTIIRSVFCHLRQNRRQYLSDSVG